MLEVRGLLQQIQHGTSGQRLGAVQKLLSLETDEYSGDQVAVPGVVLVLVALLGPSYCGLQDEVQQGAASLLLDIVSTSQVGTETLVDCQCSHMLIETMLCGTFTKRACIAAIVGLLSMCQREAAQHDTAVCTAQPSQQDTTAFYAIPIIVKLLSEAGAMHPECEGMILASLDSLVQGDAAVDLFVKAGGVQVLSQLLPRAAVTTQHGQELESDDEETNAGISEVQQMGLIALQVLHRVISSSLIGISYVIQGSVLTAVLRCTSSPCQELQLASLQIVSALAAIPMTWSAFAEVGQAWHLAVAISSSNAHIRDKALSCVRTLAGTFSPQEEELVVRLAKSLDTEDIHDHQQQQHQPHNAVSAQVSLSQQSTATLSGNLV